MNKKKEVKIESLKDNTCQVLETNKGKVAVCKEKGKIKVYPIDDD